VLFGALAGAPAASSFAGGPLAVDRPETAAQGRLDVRSGALTPGVAMAARHSAQGGNRSPPLQWSSVRGARAYALIVEDPDAPGRTPFAHWIAWNIPAATNRLPEGVPNGASIRHPVPMAQGRSDAGTIGYSGPRPPAGDPAHHYHFEVFALNAGLKAPPPGAGRDQLVAAMRGHVLAKGDLVGTYQQR
jgi:Raf kinase inhibitor-like YbhB/YbcL family protein